MILSFTVRLDLRHAAQNRHRPACTPKSLRRGVYVFHKNSFLPVTSQPRCPTRLQSACSTTNDPRSRLRFTISTNPFEYSVPSYHVIIHCSQLATELLLPSPAAVLPDVFPLLSEVIRKIHHKDVRENVTHVVLIVKIYIA